MSEDYRSMWTDLGLDPEAHDICWRSRESLWDNILSQKDRPSDGLFRLRQSGSRLRIRELLNEKEAVAKSSDLLCIRAEEIVLAANATLVGLFLGLISPWGG